MHQIFSPICFLKESVHHIYKILQVLDTNKFPPNIRIVRRLRYLGETSLKLEKPQLGKILLYLLHCVESYPMHTPFLNGRSSILRLKQNLIFHFSPHFHSLLLPLSRLVFLNASKWLRTVICTVPSLYVTSEYDLLLKLTFMMWGGSGTRDEQRRPSIVMYPSMVTLISVASLSSTEFWHCHLSSLPKEQGGWVGCPARETRGVIFRKLECANFVNGSRHSCSLVGEVVK
jgi:hypothetical protein